MTRRCRPVDKINTALFACPLHVSSTSQTVTMVILTTLPPPCTLRPEAPSTPSPLRPAPWTLRPPPLHPASTLRPAPSSTGWCRPVQRADQVAGLRPKPAAPAVHQPLRCCARDQGH